MGKNLGKGIVEFKRGLKGIENDIDEAASKSLKEADATVKKEEDEEKKEEEKKDA